MIIQNTMNSSIKEYKYRMKPLFQERMQKLLPDEQDFDKFNSIIHTHPRNFIRCNTLKITLEELVQRLEKKWKIVQPYKENKEIILIDQDLQPGELGNALEHLLGYYYIQEIVSMLPVIAMMPKPNQLIFDLCASPGSKTTQIAAQMQNQGTILANDLKIDRIKILSSNLQRCGVSNAILTQEDAISLCSKIEKTAFRFDNILLDAPCSGEGTLRSSPKTFQMWNEKVIKKLSRQQKKLIAFALKVLKPNGALIYSTCTHAPEENEEVIDFALKNFPVKIESLTLPIKSRPGITEWYGQRYIDEVQKSCRIYPQDNDAEGFFLAKFIVKEKIS